MISINLLPEDIRENISYSRKNSHLIRHIKLISILSLLIVISFVLCAVFLKEDNSFFQDKIDASQTVINSYNPVVQKAQKLNQVASSIEKIKNNYQYWSKFDAYLGATVPEGIYLDTIEENQDMMKVTGFAKTKNDIGIFRDALEKTGVFKNVNLKNITEQVGNNNNSIINSFEINMTMTQAATGGGLRK